MAEIERLTTVWDARFDKFEEKLNRVVRATYGAADSVEKRLNSVNDNINKKLGGGALTGALEGFAASAPAAAGGLSQLGTAGLAAAAGIGAVTAAFVGARSAAKFAADIADTASNLHVTTDALQEYRYAIRAAGGDEAGAERALEAFSVTLGKAQQGIKLSQRAFLSLGFTKEQIKGFKDADDALKQVSEKIAGLSNVQQDAIIQQLGLDGLKPLIAGGADEMARLRDEAHKVGIVMDAELIKRGAKLNEEFVTVSKVIDVQLKSALVDIGPILLDLLKLLASMARAAADVANAFRQIEDKTTNSLQSRQFDLTRRLSDPSSYALLEASGQGQGDAARAQDRAELARVGKELSERRKANVSRAATAQLLDTTTPRKGPRGPRDDTDQRAAQIDGEIAKASAAQLTALLALTGNLEARADLQKRILDEEANREGARLDKLIADINDDKGISQAKREEFVSQLEIARSTGAKALLDKKALIDRELEADVAQRTLDDREAVARYYDEILGIEAGLATTAKARREVELKILEHRQDEERAALRAKLDAEVAADKKSRSQADSELAAQGDSFNAQRNETLRSTEGPLERFNRENTDTALAAEKLQEQGVRAFESLADGLADAIVNAKSLGDVAKNVFRQLLSDILSQSIKSTGASLFKAFIPGFATGTNFAPGGLSLVGERGPELLNLPRGSQVIPNGVLKNMASMNPGSLGRGGSTVIQQFHLHAEGAVMTSDLISGLNQQAKQYAANAAKGAVQTVNNTFPARVRSHQLLGT